MKTFKSIPDVEQLRNHPLRDTIESLVVPVLKFYADSGHPCRPENDGYLVLIESQDVDRVLDDLDMPYRLSEVPFEGVTVVDGCFYAVYFRKRPSSDIREYPLPAIVLLGLLRIFWGNNYV